MSTRIIPFQDQMKVGFGYDLVKGSPLTSAAVSGAVSPIQGAIGQRVQSHLVRVDDLDTLHQAIGVNVDAGGSYFGVSADAKVNFAKECNVSHVSTHVMTGVTVTDAFESFDNPVLTDDAAELLRLNNSERFHQRFGDVFIDGLLKGGEYFAIFEINSVDESVRERIAVHVEASFNDLAAAAHLQVDIANESASSSAHTEVRVHVMQNGAIDHTDQSLEEILKKAHDFPPTVAGNLAVPFAVSLADYVTLKLPTDTFNFLDIQNQRDVLAEHAKKRFEFIQLLNTINYVRAHPDDFEAPDLPKLAAAAQAVTAAINTMEMEASACLQDAKACRFTPFNVTDFPLPSPKAFGSGVPAAIQAFVTNLPPDQRAWCQKAGQTRSRGDWIIQEYSSDVAVQAEMDAQGSAVYFNQKAGTIHVVLGDIYHRYKAMNAEAGQLGFPKTDEFPLFGDDNAGRQQNFDKGFMQWFRNTRKIFVTMGGHPDSPP